MKQFARLTGCEVTNVAGQRGFALVEVLVAFVVLVLAMAAISAGLGVALRSDARSQISRAALRIAQSRLEAAGITLPLAPGAREGRAVNGYRWRQTVVALQTGRKSLAAGPSGPTQVSSEAAVAPYWVEVVVDSPDGTVTKLSAVKLAYGAVQ